MKIIDFVDGLRIADASGTHDASAVDMAKCRDLLGRLGANCLTGDGKHWRPTRNYPLMAFLEDTDEGVVRTEEKKVTRRMSARLDFEICGLQPHAPGNIRASAGLDFVGARPFVVCVVLEFR